MSEHVRIAAALDGTGWHPAAWREEAARPTDITTIGYWRDLVQTAEKGGVDFVTLEDSFLLQGLAAAPGEGPFDGSGILDDSLPAPLRGRLDALLIASAIAPATSRIGLVPTVTTTQTEPFHVATALQTLDHTSRGRAGWRLQVSPRDVESDLFGRRTLPAAFEDRLTELFGEAADVAEVVRRLWDSWEDDAVIRDLETGRYIDRDRIHGAKFEGQWFSVEGASIVPRPPQGQPPVTVLAHQTVPYELAARQGDLVYVTPKDDASARSILDEVRQAEERVGRAGEALLVYADLLVVVEDTEAEAAAALARLDDLAGAPIESDALVVATDVEGLVALIRSWSDLGYAGFRLRPARLPVDLDAISARLIPALEKAGLRDGDLAPAGTLRQSLGLDLPENRYTAARNDSHGDAGHDTRSTATPKEVVA
jgi:alkanesulfonate monooxygenase SsuD/methylene tetrahydromethanopterin reductase-like flavin-dependent oxidoreductase (luciferase family)